ncbi:MAG: AI-2E family transporter [Gemmobacter sp.]
MTEQPAIVPTAAARPSSYPRWAVIGIFLIAAIGAISIARDFLMPVVSGCVLFLVFMPLMRRARRLGIPRAAAAAGIVVSMLLVLSVIVVSLRGPAVQIVENFPEISRQVGDKLSDVMDSFRRLDRAVGEAMQTGDGAAPDAATDSPAAPAPTEEADFSLTDLGGANVVSVFLTAPTILAQVLFTAILLYFLLASGDMFYLKIIQSFGTLRQKRDAYRVLRRIETGLGDYFGAITLINAVLGVAVGIAMWMLGMPVPVMFAVLTFVLNFIPFVGAVLGVVIVGAVSLLWFDGFAQPALVVAVFLILTGIEGQFITPLMVSRKTQMNTAVLFVAVAFWAWLWSFMGMLVAVPLMVAIRVIAEHVPGMGTVANFLSGEDEKPLPPAAEDEPEEETLPPMDIWPRRA